MAFVEFWKLPAAQYNPATHGKGIFQCSDTGDTYIFGVLNTSLSEENKSNVEKIIQGVKTLYSATHVLDENAFIVEGGKVKLNFQCVAYLKSPTDKAEHKVAIPEATTSQNGLISASDKTKVNKLVINGNGKSYLNNAGQYVNPFPIVSQEEALTINSDGSLGHKAIVDMKAWDTTSTPLTLSQLNSTYPDAPVGFIVVQYNAQVEYEKVSSTNQWVKRQVELLTD